MMVKRTSIFAVLLSLAALLSSAPAYAQEAAAPVAAAPDAAAGLAAQDLKAPFTGSFFLTPLEIAVIQQAMKGKISGSSTMSMGSKRGAPPPPGVIRLSGVVYHAADNWIVWMNGHKVTPDNLLPEIVDIRVMDSSKVALQWYDAGVDKVISITMRPQQVYDIATGILLPGSQ